MRRRNDCRFRSNPLNSDALRYYEATATGMLPVLAFDLYADSTTLSKSGSQSACLIRIRPANVVGRSNQWHDVGIAPHLASRIGVSIGGELFVVRLMSLVADQPQERAFSGLKSAGSFIDCSLCMQPSLTFSYNIDDAQEVPDEFQQNCRHTKLTIGARSYHCPKCNEQSLANFYGVHEPRFEKIRTGNRRSYNRINISNARLYLRRVSASLCPPALAAVHGLGTAPFNLYSCVALDTLHAVDLGLSRSLPDLAYSVFASAEYNKSILSKTALVRISNQRFADCARKHGVYIQPFRLTGTDVHANMTAATRRAIVPFLWPCLLGLQ
eukprot:IDg2760t1